MLQLLLIFIVDFQLLLMSKQQVYLLKKKN